MPFFKRGLLPTVVVKQPALVCKHKGLTLNNLQLFFNQLEVHKIHQNRFFATAFPEPDLKYFSKFLAKVSVSTAT